MLTGTNTRVGVAEGIQGTCQVLAAFPAGYLADRYRRDTVLKYAGYIGQLAAFVVLCALFSSHLLSAWGTTTMELELGPVEDGRKEENRKKIEFVLLCIGLGLFGCFTGASNAPLEALFADSTTTEERPKVSVRINLCMAAPPFFFILV